MAHRADTLREADERVQQDRERQPLPAPTDPGTFLTTLHQQGFMVFASAFQSADVVNGGHWKLKKRVMSSTFLLPVFCQGIGPADHFAPCSQLADLHMVLCDRSSFGQGRQQAFGQCEQTTLADCIASNPKQQLASVRL